MNEGIAKNEFDRKMGALEGINDVTRSKASTVQTISTMLGHTRTCIVQTVRQREVGDFIFVQMIDAAEDGSARAMRFVLPPAVADVIARQRDGVSAIVRRKLSKEQAQARKAAGLKPGYQMSAAERRAAKARKR